MTKIFKLPRKNIFYDEVEVNPEEIRSQIPETIQYDFTYLTPEQISSDKHVHYDEYLHLYFTRPNPARLAADEFTVDDMRFYGPDPDCGQIKFHRNKTGKKYIYSWGPDYDPGIWYHFYLDDGIPRIQGHIYEFSNPPRLTRLWIEVPGYDYAAFIQEEPVDLSDLEVWLQECIGQCTNDNTPIDSGWTGTVLEEATEDYG